MKKSYFYLLIITLTFFSFSLTAQDYKVQYQCGVTSDLTDQIRPYFQIVNLTAEAVQLSDLEIRYYYLKEGYVKEENNVDYAVFGSENASLDIFPGYLSITFKQAAGEVAADSVCGPIMVRLNKEDWSTYDQTNDYSYDPSKSGYEDWDQVALYLEDTLVWGPTEGEGGAPIPTPTPAPTEPPTLIPPENLDYTDALEKAVWFYDANKCGPEAGADNVHYFRDACHTTDGLDSVYWDLTGGYHDAGDHVKFGLPQGFSASMLGWAFYEYKEIFDENGVTDKLLATLKHFTDYFLKSMPSADVFYYHVGDGDTDHDYWGRPEDQTGERPVMAPATPANSASDITGITSSALALMALNYTAIDAGYAQQCLDAAIDLYNLACNDNSRGEDGGDFYNTSAHYDDLSWAAIWLAVATGDDSYLDSVYDWQNIPGDYGGSNWEFAWAPNWDNITPFVMLKMAELTNETIYKDALVYSLEWVRDSADRTVNGNLPYIDTWGALRYAAAEAGLGFLAEKNVNYDGYVATGDLSMAYILGDNPRSSSYLTGWGYNGPVHPHHRANEPSKGGLTFGIIGALVGGPDINDEYIDDVEDFKYNEVTIDYNACLVLGLAGKLYSEKYRLGGGEVPTPTPTVTSTITPTPEAVLMGDVNGDGAVTIVDALQTGQYYVGLDVPGINTQAADVDGNGSITIVDALQIAQLYVGLIDSF